ncbi:MAG: alpha/beta fold hydrolase [Acidimicrobiales bacterium]
MSVVHVSGRSLDCATWGAGPAEIVLLHDGLGSIAQWRDIPAAISAATGRTVFAYNRAGHGTSTPVPTGPWPNDWLAREAQVLGEVLDTQAVDRPLLVGHSDGGSIALLAAVGGRALRGIVTLAAHAFVEDVCVERIRAMRTDKTAWVARLAHVHDHPAAVFDAWSGVWTGAAFRAWDMRPDLPLIDCPTVIIQGLDDEYGTPEQAWSTAAAVGENASCLLLPEAGHLLHHEVPDRIVGLVREIEHSLPM